MDEKVREYFRSFKEHWRAELAVLLMTTGVAVWVYIKGPLPQGMIQMKSYYPVLVMIALVSGAFAVTRLCICGASKHRTNPFHWLSISVLVIFFLTLYAGLLTAATGVRIQWDIDAKNGSTYLIKSSVMNVSIDGNTRSAHVSRAQQIQPQKDLNQIVETDFSSTGGLIGKELFKLSVFDSMGVEIPFEIFEFIPSGRLIQVFSSFNKLKKGDTYTRKAEIDFPGSYENQIKDEFQVRSIQYIESLMISIKFNNFCTIYPESTKITQTKAKGEQLLVPIPVNCIECNRPDSIAFAFDQASPGMEFVVQWYYRNPPAGGDYK